MNDYTYAGDPEQITRTGRQRGRANAESNIPTESRGRRISNHRNANPPQPEPEEPQPNNQSNSDNVGFFKRVAQFFSDRRTRTVIGVALFLLAGYLTIAAFSFFSANEADQSLVVTQSASEIVESGRNVENLAGPVGAAVSHHLFVEGLGLGSFVVIVYMIMLALSLFGIYKVKFWSLTFKSLLLAITLSMFFGLVTVNSSSTIPLGGFHGRFANLFLISHINWIGAVLVNVMLITIVVTVFIAQLKAIYNTSREKIRTIRAAAEHEIERRKNEQDKINDSLDGPLSDDTEASNEEEITPNNHGEGNQVNLFIVDPNDDAEVVDIDDVKDDERRTKPSDLTSIEDLASPEDENGEQTPFDVKAADEIEQAKTENSAYEAQGPYDPRAELSRFRMPSINLLRELPHRANSVDLDEQEENKERITKVLSDFGIQIVKIDATVGPTVTLYKIVPAEGVRIAKIKRLEEDIAMSLAALGIRIIAPIPGESNIGIEVPNKDPETVSIRSILGSKAFQETKYALPIALGATINNEVYIADLAKMPHLLVAGATGQGKSVGLNTIIASLLYKRHPSELKFVLVDPKQVEFSLYSRLSKHYLAQLPDAEEPVITDCNKVVDTLNSLCVEMDARYSLLKEAGCRSITEYNDRFIHRRLNPEHGHRYMPYIVMIVDEFADLIMMAGKSVETPIARIAQKARAVGMHLIIATQRPSTNVITGMIKANFPGRIAFAVRQRVDSQTILDCTGANQLIGKGDMLISTGGALKRVQCAYIDTEEVDTICRFIDDQVGFPTPYILPEPPSEASENQSFNTFGERDPLFDEIARLVVQGNTASTSNIQRRYSIGYNRAGKIMDQMEAAGIVGPAQGGKPRQVLITPVDLEAILNSNM